jgi:hypothetical protein
VRALQIASILAAGACFLAVDACAHLTNGSVPSVAPTPAASATALSAACNQTAAANAQIVAISPLITPTVDPTYGLISGYGLATTGSSSNVAATIVVAPTATVQFFNNDQSTSQLRYSAVGIPNVTTFPGPTFTFPPAAVNQTGTQINATSSWSTGLLPGQCYSQVFTIAAAGTYFFGDYTYYALGNIRDVIVATSSPGL